VIHRPCHGGVLFVTLDNPAARNALNDAMLAGLHGALDTARAARSVRAVLLRGAQGNFCAGGDFTQFKALMATVPGDPDPTAESNRAFGGKCPAAWQSQLTDWPELP
jgi:isohexenylglutaconyl-CoA hydratase